MARETGAEQPAGDRPGLLGRLTGGGGGNRSSFVYLVVGLVAVTLTVLLAIIYFSASERERTSPPICTDITEARAQRAVLAGEVERLTVVYDESPLTPTSERYGPVLAKLDYVDGSCSNLPQGVVNQEVVYTIAGVIAFYNENTDGQKVEILYQKSGQLDDELFLLPTATPTLTPTPEPTATLASTPSPTPRPVVTGTPVASPVASPAIRPTAPPTPTEVSLP
jgi:hypothetical protein